MSEEHVWVVGDCLARFAGNEGVETLGGVLSRPEERPGGQNTTVLHPGMGVDRTSWRELEETILARGLSASMSLHGEPPRPVARHRVLKQSQDNVLIGDAHASGETIGASLTVPNDTEMIRDHTADQQHLPGMLLIEAAIQLVTWGVGETVPRTSGGKARYAVMHRCGFSFHRFVFPLPTTLRARLSRSGEADEDRVPLTARVETEQAGETTGVYEFELNAFDPHAVFEAEAGQARRTLTRTGPPEKR
ncbi:AfsA-related hotdog domain-containing protein [Actinopolyspora mortivallis]|uniref:AfsA-related hotdog domain-containing protein n=1 Tax=Actinopolyspora mortivallis TaxID=33906 RepID=UPI00036447CC|nr:AfsA-related hotdog domain-containing protein [Actinopolyspora mortivallis]